MSQAIFYIISFIICVWDMLMLNIFLNAMSVRRRIGGYKFLAYYAVAVLMIYAINMQGSTILNFLAVPLVQFFFCLAVFTITLHKAVINVAVFHLVFVGGSETVFEIFYRFLSEAVPGIEPVLRFAGGTPVFLIEYLLDSLFLLYLSRYMKKIEISEDNRFDWCLLIMPVSSFLILSAFAYMEFPSARNMQILMCAGAFLLYFANAAVFMILAHFTQVMKQAKMAELSLLKRDMEKENFENVIKANEVYRKYMHDIHKYFYQFRCLALSGESEAIVKVIDGWERNLKCEKLGRIYTNDPVFNSLLSKCDNEAQGKGVKTAIFVENAIDISFIEDVDKISMFGNLFDNAVEAAVECKEDRREIRIRMYMGSKYFLVLRIENTWEKKQWMEGEQIFSTKKHVSGHGLGIGIVRELAEKYGGDLQLEEKDDWFSAVLMVSRSA